MIFHSYVSHYQRVLSNVHNELRAAGLAAEVGVFKLRDHHGQAAAERYQWVFTSGRCENQGLTRLNKNDICLNKTLYRYCRCESSVICWCFICVYLSSFIYLCVYFKDLAVRLRCQAARWWLHQPAAQFNGGCRAGHGGSECHSLSDGREVLPSGND